MNLNNRINAFLVDCAYVFVIQIVTSIIVNFFLFSNSYYFELNLINYFLFFNSFVVLLIFKDVPKNGSIGKQKYDLSLEKEDGGEVPLFSRLIRNIPLLIGIFDFIVLKIYNKRIGDAMLKIKVIERNRVYKTNLQSKILFLIFLSFISVLIEVSKSNFPTYSLYFDSKYKEEIERIEANINTELRDLAYKSDVHITGKNMKIRLFTKHRYNDDSLFFVDKKAVKASLPKYIDTSMYKISVELITDMGSKKYFSTFKINQSNEK